MSDTLVTRLRDTGAGRGAIWLDALDYGQCLILHGKDVPWFDAPAYIAFARELHALLRADVTTFDVERFYHACLAGDPGLRSSMGGKTRPGFALKTLLGASAPRARQLDLLAGLRASFGDRPLVLQIPSPQRWVGLAHAMANDLDAVEVSLDDAESGAMYIADFLSHFSGAGIDGALLTESPGGTFDPGERETAYRPVINVAEHYRWQLGVKALGMACLATTDSAFAFGITDGPPLAALTGGVLPDGFWSGDAAPAADFHYGRIPPEAVPETVLQQLAHLRG